LPEKEAKRGKKFAKDFLRLTSEKNVKKVEKNNPPVQTAREIARRHHPPPFGWCGGKRPKDLLIH
jgi:hypothetical protein